MELMNCEKCGCKDINLTTLKYMQYGYCPICGADLINQLKEEANGKSTGTKAGNSDTATS